VDTAAHRGIVSRMRDRIIRFGLAAAKAASFRAAEAAQRPHASSRIGRLAGTWQRGAAG
jgi:hypothetical protein